MANASLKNKLNKLKDDGFFDNLVIKRGVEKEFFRVNKSYGARYSNSAIPAMQRMLYRDISNQQESLKKLKQVFVTNQLCL